jgi:hypothetical protein
MIRSAEFRFDLLNMQFRNEPPLSTRLNVVTDVPMLFIQASDDPELGAISRKMFLKASGPREQAIIGLGNFVAMNDDDKRAYENRVVSFFVTHLPATAHSAH